MLLGYKTGFVRPGHILAISDCSIRVFDTWCLTAYYYLGAGPLLNDLKC